MKTKILFIDDNREILEVMVVKFEDLFDVYTADNGADGIELKKKHNIRIIITDLQMPEMNGVEVCRTIKASDPFSILIALTGQWEIFELVNCRENGFDDYVTKPCDFDGLTEILHDAEKKFMRWSEILDRAKGKIQGTSES